jgi:hypothetical protein
VPERNAECKALLTHCALSPLRRGDERQGGPYLATEFGTSFEIS